MSLELMLGRLAVDALGAELALLPDRGLEAARETSVGSEIPCVVWNEI